MISVATPAIPLAFTVPHRIGGGLITCQSFVKCVGTFTGQRRQRGEAPGQQQEEPLNRPSDFSALADGPGARWWRPD